MKRLFLIATLIAPNLAVADTYILGAGRWSCADMLAASENQDMAKVYQVIGWLMGFWSAETSYRGSRFLDIVEQAGGEAIYNQTLVECRKAPEGALIYQVATSMIINTH